MKKILAVLLATVMLLALLAACGDSGPGEQTAANTLTVGYGAAATGAFIEGFGNQIGRASCRERV